MSYRIFLFIAGLFFATSAQAQQPYDICADPAGAAIPAGYQIAERSMVVGPHTRWYCVATPAGYSTTGPDMPLVIVLHGGSGNPQVMMANPKRFLAEGLARGYVVVFAAGLGDPDRCDMTMPCQYNYWGDAENIDFLNAIIAEAATFNLDEDRIYLAGFSGGARLIYRAIEADSFPYPIAAIATAAGSLGAFKVDNPAGGFPITNVAMGNPVPAVLFQGEADEKMAFGGGLSDGDSELQLPFQIKIDMFRVLNGATADPGAPVAGAGNRTLYSLGTEDILTVSQAGVGHEWPGPLTPIAFDFFDAH